MGNYLNPGIDGFVKTINSEIYIDKTGLLNYTNRVINTLQGYLCVSRPRRFGKSVTATMLAAYYSCECDSKELFAPFEIAKSPDFETYLNQYDTIFLNMQEFLSQSQDMDDMLALIRKSVLWELLEKYPAYRYFDNTNLPRTMQDIYNKSKRPFIVIIDEWDCVFREYKLEQGAQEKYLDFLRDLLKDKAYIHLAYMTGILPIKKYGTHSALNMFDEFSMLNPGPLASYVGFTENEDYTTVKVLTEVQNNGGVQERELIDHNITVDMAKHICMVQRTEKAKEVRQYLIDLEKAWNTPEQVMARALKLADKTIEGLKTQLLEAKPKVDFFNAVADSKTAISTNEVAKVLAIPGYVPKSNMKNPSIDPLSIKVDVFNK